MLKNYLKSTFRYYARMKSHVAINVAGMALGMAACILILLWVYDELSVDRFHKNYANIYRVITENQHADGIKKERTTPFALAPFINENIPEVQQSLRTVHLSTFIGVKDENLTNFHVLLCDQNVLKVFTLPLIQGDPATALQDKNSIILSQQTSARLFGNENPLGKTVHYSSTYDLTVTGVLAHVPANSNWNVDCIVPLAIFSPDITSSWHFSFANTYFLLDVNANLKDVTAKIASVFQSRYPESRKSFIPMALSTLHLHGINGDGVLKHVMIFSTIALSILFIACFNFINLSTARAQERRKEVGMRKVIGARRKDLIIQYFLESIPLIVISLILAIMIIDLVLPQFNTLTGKQLALYPWGNKTIFAGILSIALLTGIFSGSYPAIVLSRFKPISNLSDSSATGKRKSRAREFFVVTQFVISIILMFGTLIISRQLQFIQNKDLGYKQQSIVSFSAIDGFKTHFEELKQELLANPNITNVARSSSLPNYTERGTTDIEWSGQSPEFDLLVYPFYVDYGFIETFQFEILAGRSFSQHLASDTSAYLLNQTALKMMGKTETEILGHQITFNGKTGPVIGVLKDFHHSSLYDIIEPIVVVYQPGFIVSVRIHPENRQETLAFLRTKWTEHVHSYPFEYDFFDDVLRESYARERMARSIVNYFSVLAILISALGLYGLISYYARTRTKEIGIRKVLGASMPGILYILFKDLTKWLFYANLIAWPIAYYVMTEWLQNFAYRIAISWWMFLLAGLLTLVIALITVSFQSIRAALANPVESLRYE